MNSTRNPVVESKQDIVHHPHLPHWVVILLLLFIPPVGWWHMWKNHRYHTWFPYVLWLNAAITLGFSVFVLVHYYSLLKRFFDAATYIFAGHIGLLVFSIAEIIFGFYLIEKFKNDAMLRRRILAMVIALLFINTIAIPLSQLIIKAHLENRANSLVITTPQSNSETTENWKMYTFPDAGVTFKYPKGYIISFEGKENLDKKRQGRYVYFATTEKEKESFAACMRSEIPECFIFSLGVSINWAGRDTYSSLKDFMSGYSLQKESATQETILGGKKAVEITGKDGQGLGVSRSFFVETNNMYVYINGQSTTGDAQLNMSKFEQILSTFTFLEKNELTTYTSKKVQDNSFPAYTLQHRPDWKEQEAYDPTAFHTLVLSKNGYAINISQGAFDGNYCIFNDTPDAQKYLNDEDGHGENLTKAAFTDITTKYGIFRRYMVVANNQNHYHFCYRSSNSDLFGIFSNVGLIGYTTPTNPDPAMLSEMDTILESIAVKK